MRFDVKKMLFVGIKNNLTEFFKKAQDFGLVHFIQTNGTGIKELPPDIQHFTSAIKILRGLPTAEQEESVDSLQADRIAQEIIRFKNQLDKLNEDVRILQLEVARVEIFGDFSMDQLKLLEKETDRKIQFFFGKRSAFEKNQTHGELIYIGSDHGLDYFISINKESSRYEGLVEMHIDHPVGELKRDLQKNKDEIREIEQKLKSYAKFNRFLHHSLILHMNRTNLSAAQNCAKVVDDAQLFAVYGWVPVNQISDLQSFVQGTDIYMEEIALDPHDLPPTYLENQGLGLVGEDVIHIYDTPSNTDDDPSSWVLWAFALFFGIIVGDAGYGAIYLIIALILRYKFPNLRGFKKRALNLMTILSSGAVIWGIMINSYFAIPTPIDSPVRKFSLVQWLAEKKAAYHIKHKDSTYDYWIGQFPQLKDIKDPYQFLAKGVKDNDGEKSYPILDKFSDNIMMEAALFIGVVHLLISLFRYLPRNWTHMGWIIFLIGGYLYFPTYLHVTSLIHYVFGVPFERGGEVGFQLMTGGVAIAFLISIIKNKFLAIMEAMNLVQIFSDTLSYLRLYALGLSGAIVGATINELAAFLPFLLSVIVLIIAHMVNMLLGIMSGVIHGLRLNFLEWYHYSFEGGGKKFQPLRWIDPED